MRALHVAAGNLYGGAETLLVTLARERACAPGLEPAFAVCFEGRLASELEAAGVPAHVLGAASARRPWTVLAARRRLRELLAREPADAVVFHGCWPHALLASAARRARTLLVLWLHDAPSGRSWVERLARRTRPDRIVANSRFTANAAIRLFPGVPVEVLHAPVALAPAPLDARARVRAALGASPDSVVIATACRLERWKGHGLLLDALALLRDDPRWTAWIAGGPQRPHEARFLHELEARAAELGLAGRVRFLGERTDVRELLAAADLHCQPNVGPEPFGIAFVEALAAGLPVVTTALGGALEIVDARSGVLVAPEASAVAAALRALVADPRERARLAAAGPARARELCDPARQLSRLAELLAPLGRAASVAS